jgi:hypothetical protein
MPAALAPVISSAIGVVVSAATVGAILQATLLVGSLASSASRARRARRASNASLTDRTTPVRSSAEPRTIVYGKTRVSGPLVYHVTHGARRESVSHVVALAGHQIHAIDEVWFNDESIGPLAVDGGVQAGSKYYVSANDQITHSWTGGGAGSTQVLPLDGADSFIALNTIAYITPTEVLSAGNGDAGTYITGGTAFDLVEGVDYSISGSTVTLLTGVAQGQPVTATYQVNRGTGYAYAYPFLGIVAGQRDTNLETWSGGEWTATDLGNGAPRVHVLNIWNETIYATGFPSVSCVVRGKLVYDPRLDSTNGGTGSHRADTPSTWAYSDNPALCVADYLRDALGFGCASSKVDWPSVIEAANICDELVPTDGASGTQKRYTLAGVLSTEDARKENLEALLAAMVGTAFYSAGKWTIRAGAYRTPTLDLDESDLAGGDITVQARLPRRDLFNAVRGKFRDPAQLYAVTDFPPYSSATYITEDGGQEIYRDIELPFVDDVARAQRVAKLILFRSRQALTIAATWKLSAYALQPGDTVRLTIARYGWTTKVFRVAERSFEALQSVRLVLQEEASAVYAWDFDEARDPDPAPNTSLPSPGFVAPPRDVSVVSTPTSFAVRTDGTVVPYVDVSWGVPTADDVLTEVFWKRSIDTAYRRATTIARATSVRLEPVSGGEVLNIYLVHVNALGARSRPVFILPSYTVNRELPRAGDVAPQSANLLKNASLDLSAGAWTAIDFTLPAGSTTLEKRTDGVYAVVGSPSSANIVTVSTATGAQYVGAYAERISVTPGRRYVAYCGVIGWDTPAYVAAQVFGENDVLIAGYDGNVVSAGAWEGALRWNTPAHYENSIVFFEAPPGARTVRFIVVGGGVWPAITNPFNARWVSFFRPFFGEVQPGINVVPSWDPGGNNMVSTDLIARGAVNSVYPGTGSQAVASFSGAPSVSVNGPTVTADSDGSLQISVTFTVQMSANNSDAVAFIAYLAPSAATGSKGPATGPIIATVAAATTQIGTYSFSTTVPVSQGQVIQTSLIIDRVAVQSLPTDSGVVTKPVVLYKAAGGLYGVDFSVVLIKR